MGLGMCLPKCCDKLCDSAAPAFFRYNEGRDPIWKWFFELTQTDAFVDPANFNTRVFDSGSTTYRILETVSWDGSVLTAERNRGDGYYIRLVFGNKVLVGTNAACGITTWNMQPTELYMSKGPWVVHYSYHDGKTYTLPDHNVVAFYFSQGVFCYRPQGELYETTLLCPAASVPASWTFNINRGNDDPCPKNPAVANNTCCPAGGKLSSSTRVVNSTPSIRDGWCVQSTVGTLGSDKVNTPLHGYGTTPLFSSFSPGVPTSLKTIASIELRAPAISCFAGSSELRNTGVTVTFADVGNSHGGISIVGGNITISASAPAMGFAVPYANAPCLSCYGYNGILQSSCNLEFSGGVGATYDSPDKTYSIAYRFPGTAVSVS